MFHIVNYTEINYLIIMNYEINHLDFKLHHLHHHLNPRRPHTWTCKTFHFNYYPWIFLPEDWLYPPLSWPLRFQYLVDSRFPSKAWLLYFLNSTFFPKEPAAFINAFLFILSLILNQVPQSDQKLRLNFIHYLQARGLKWFNQLIRSPLFCFFP